MDNMFPSGFNPFTFMTTPQPGATMPQEMPPTDDEDLKKRKEGWLGALNSMFSNPQAVPIAMMVGARLLQGKKPGQSTAGAMGEAAVTGLQTKWNLDEMARKEEDAKSVREARAAQVAGTKAQTEATIQSTAQSADLHPKRLDKLTQELDLSKLEIGIAKSKAAVQAALDAKDPEGIARAQNILDQQSAELDRIKASTAASRASVTASNASANATNQTTNLRKTLTDPNASEEDKAAAERGLRGGKSTGQEAADRMAFTAKWVKKAHPDWTEQQVADHVLNMQSGKKGEAFEALKSLYENATGEDRKAYEKAMEKIARGDDPTPTGGGDNSARTRFAADPAMKGNTLGAQTPKGIEVKNAAGKVIGYYN